MIYFTTVTLLVVLINSNSINYPIDQLDMGLPTDHLGVHVLCANHICTCLGGDCMHICSIGGANH